MCVVVCGGLCGGSACLPCSCEGVWDAADGAASGGSWTFYDGYDLSLRGAHRRDFMEAVAAALQYCQGADLCQREY